MITSMTGFGRGAAASDGIQVTVEIKTLNSRYLDISTRLPSTLQEKELELKELLLGKIRRGKVTVTVNIDRSETDSPEVTFSPKLTEGYGKMLEEIRLAAGITQPVELRDLISFSDIFVRRPEDEKTLRKIWKLTLKACRRSLDMTIEMRNNEGGQLRNELCEQIDSIEKLLGSIRKLAGKRAPDAMKRFRERMRNLIGDESIDPDRLEHEIAILIDKMDMQEELIRLESHIKFFREALGSREPVGRRLNFLCQEVNRELNTIGSKANDSEISQLVVRSKEHLEQVREQVQNIE